MEFVPCSQNLALQQSRMKPPARRQSWGPELSRRHNSSLSSDPSEKKFVPQHEYPGCLDTSPDTSVCELGAAKTTSDWVFSGNPAEFLWSVRCGPSGTGKTVSSAADCPPQHEFLQVQSGANTRARTLVKPWESIDRPNGRVTTWKFCLLNTNLENVVAVEKWGCDSRHPWYLDVYWGAENSLKEERHGCTLNSPSKTFASMGTSWEP